MELSTAASIVRAFPASGIRKLWWKQEVSVGRSSVVRSSGSGAGRMAEADESLNLKPGKQNGNMKRAARKTVSVVLQVDRARLKDIEVMARKSARLVPQALLEALAERIQARQWEVALKTFELLRRQEWYEPKQEMYLKLLVLLDKCKQPDRASELFETMLEEKLEPSVESYTALMSAYMTSGRVTTAFRLLAHMRISPDCQPDVHTHSMMIKRCCEAGLFDKASCLLDEMQELGVQPNNVTFNTLIDAFGKAGMLQQMEELFEEMLESTTCKPDSWSWNIIIKSYGKKQEIEKMEEWFENMQAAGVEPDMFTLNSLIHAYGNHGSLDKMRSVANYMRKYFFRLDQVTFNSMLEGYGKWKMIDDMESTFVAMKRQGIKPNAFTYSFLFSTYSKHRMWNQIEKLRRQWKNSDLVPDVPLYNSLMDAYRREGNLEKLEAAFGAMKTEGLKPDEVTYTILASAYRSNGLRVKAEEMKSKMKALEQ